MDYLWQKCCSRLCRYLRVPLIFLGPFILVVCSLSHVQLFASPWTAAHQASLSFIRLYFVISIAVGSGLILKNVIWSKLLSLSMAYMPLRNGLYHSPWDSWLRHASFLLNWYRGSQGKNQDGPVHTWEVRSMEPCYTSSRGGTPDKIRST